MKWGIIVASLVMVGACARANSQDKPETQDPAGEVYAAALRSETASARVAGNIAGMRTFVGGRGGGPGGQPGARAGGSGAVPAGQPATVPVPADRKVIKNGDVSLEVASLDEALNKIRLATASSGGYIVGETQRVNEYGVRYGWVSCRIPAASLDALLATFQGYGKVRSIELHAEDITEQYFNIEMRLRNAQMLEDRLLKLLDKAGSKVSELVEVEREVARVRGEIDQLDGQRRFWDKQVAFSRLSISLNEPGPSMAASGGGVIATFKRAFGRTGENVLATVAWCIEASGVVIPALVMLWLLWRIWKALRSSRKR